MYGYVHYPNISPVGAPPHIGPITTRPVCTPVPCCGCGIGIGIIAIAILILIALGVIF